MAQSRKTVGLIFGGQGYESEVSLLGEKYIRPWIQKNYDCIPIFIDKNGRWLFNNQEILPHRGGFIFPDTQNRIEVDCAFPLLHGNFGEDGIIQGALDSAGIPYVGCSGRVGAICRNKAVVKAVAKLLKVPTLPFVLVSRENFNIQKIEDSLDYPMFVKPTDLGSSYGANEARDKNQLILALNNAFALSDRVIIENLIEPKRELECGYLQYNGKHLFTNCGEITYTKGFYDYSKKYFGGAKVIEKACVDQKVNETIKEYSLRLVKFLGVIGLSRIDFFLSGDEIYFNEINTMPGFTKDSLYLKMLSASGISPETAIKTLIDSAIG